VADGVGVTVGLVVLVAFGLADGLAVGTLVAFGVAVAFIAEEACFGPVITRTTILPVKPAVAVGVPKRSESACTISDTTAAGTSDEYCTVVDVAV